MDILEFVNIDKNKFNVLNLFFNKGSRPRNLNTIDTVVLHWTAANNVAQAVSTLKVNRLGYHFLISKDGVITQGSPVSRRVGHAGVSYGPNGGDVNSYSIGISLDILNENQEINDEMYQAVTNLILDLKIILPEIKFLTGHHWISPGRKIDPFTFDFERIKNAVGFDLTIWRTGDAPFPTGLRRVNDTTFIGQGGLNYHKSRLSTVVNDLSFGSDLDTE